MNMYKKYALILSVLMISQVSSPAVNVLADENNTSQSYQNETSNEKTSESIEVLQKQNEIVNIPDANLKKVLNKVLNQSENDDITLEQLENITEINAVNSGISSIEGLQYCKNLKYLELMHNRIRDFKPIENLSNLEGLDVAGNRISDLKVFKNLKSLKFLDVSRNSITKIEGLEELSNLEQLFLDKNQIAIIEGLETLTNLNRLVLSNNGIYFIEGLEKLSNLEYLYLRDNEINHIENISHLSKLRLLELSNNHVAEVQGLEELTNLEYLYLTKNRIDKIEGLEGLTKLGDFDISDQEIYLFSLEAKDSSLEIDNVLVSLNGEVIKPSEISGGGNYNSETNKIKWDNILKNGFENYSFAKDIEIGNANGIFSGIVLQPITYTNFNEGNTDIDNNKENDVDKEDGNDILESENDALDSKDSNTTTTLPATGQESSLPLLSLALLSGGAVLVRKKR